MILLPLMQEKLYLFPEVIFIILRIFTKVKLNSLLHLIMRDQKILEYLEQLVRWLTGYLAIHLVLILNTLAISKVFHLLYRLKEELLHLPLQITLRLFAVLLALY